MIKTIVVLSLASIAIATMTPKAKADITEVFNYTPENIGQFQRPTVIFKTKNPTLFSIRTDVPKNLAKNADPFGYKNADQNGLIMYDILPMFGLNEDLIPKTIKYKVIGKRKFFTIQGRKKLNNGSVVMTTSKVFSVPANRTVAHFLWGAEVKLVR